MPLFVLALSTPRSNRPFIAEVGAECAIVAFTILALQFVISARLRWVEAPFGLDVLLRFHRTMALVAMGLLCIHPLFVAWGESWGLLTRWRVHWSIWAGRLAILLLFAHGFIAVSRRVVRLRYKMWRRIHTIAAISLLGLTLVHSLARGADFGSAPAKTLWAALVCVAGSAWLYARLIRPHLLGRRSYKVVSIAPETPQVWTLTLEHTTNSSLHYAPGQFQFLRPHHSSIPAEEHPFSIASSPTSGSRISLTIKASGDFTSTIERLEPGNLVAVHGPFGRFSHLFHGNDEDLVFVAAGIGITPLMSMLRYMRDRRDCRRVLLLYANRTASDIVFRNELEQIEAGGFPCLKTIHILSRPSDDWAGPCGRLDPAALRSFCGSLSGKAFFICCPPKMTSGLIRGLVVAGVSPNRIHTDHFEI
jgi:predicted ferric reductase